MSVGRSERVLAIITLSGVCADLKQRGADSDPTLTLPLNLKDLEVLPEIVIMSSKADVTVPW